MCVNVCLERLSFGQGLQCITHREKARHASYVWAWMADCVIGPTDRYESRGVADQDSKITAYCVLASMIRA